MAFDVGTAVGYLDLDTSGFKTGFKSALDDLNTFNNTANGSSERMVALGSAFTSVGSTLTTNVTLPLVGIGTAAVAVGNQFESGMSRVQAISGATGDELEALTDQALELGSSTAFSASEAAAGMENLASAGFTVTEIMDAMPGLLDLAASSGSDLATASGIAASAIRGFGLEADSAGHVADVFAEAAARTNAQVEDMGEAMKYVAPVASAMGQSLEETSAAIGIMSDAGIAGSQAGTALRGALSRLAKPTEAMTNVMTDLGLSFFDSEGNMLSLSGIVGQLETKMAGLTQEQRNQALVTLFGQESLSGMLALMDRGSAELTDLTNSFKQCDGAAAEMADVMMDNTSGAIEEMMGSLETLAIKLQQVLAPMVTAVAQAITNAINKISSMDESTLKLIVTIAGIVAAVGPVLTVLGKLIKSVDGTISAFRKLPGVVKVIKTSFTTVATATKNVFEGFKLAKAGMTALGAQASPLGAAIAGISGPVLAVVAAIAVLVAAFVNLWKNNEEFRTKVTDIWNGIVGMFTDFFSQITEKINSLGFNFENFGEVLKTLWNGLCEFLAPVFIGAFQYISDTIQVILDVILGVFDFFISVFKGDWEGAWDAIQGIFVSVWDYIVAWFKNAGDTLMSILDVVCGWFGTTWEALWEGVVDFFKTAWDSICEFFRNAWESIADFFQTTADKIVTGVSNFLNSVVTFFSELPGNIATWLTEAINNVANWVNNLIEKAIQVGSDVIDAIVEFFSELPNKLAYQLGYALGFIAAWVDQAIQEAIKVGTEFLSSVTEFFSQLPGTVWDFLVQTYNKIVTWGTNAITSALTTASEFLAAIVEFFQQLPGTVWGFLTEAYKNVVTWGSDLLNKAVETATGFLNTVIDYVSQLPGKLWNLLSQALQNVISWGSSLGSSAMTSASNFLNSIVSYISQLPGQFQSWFNQVLSFLSGIPSQMYSAGSSMLSSLWNGLKSVWNSLWSWVSGIASKIASAFQSAVAGAQAGASSVSGSYATGLDYVPRDMIVKVHQGESIRTKQQTREDLSQPKQDSSPKQPVNVTLEVDGRVLGRVAISNINDITDTDGKVPLKV